MIITAVHPTLIVHHLIGDTVLIQITVYLTCLPEGGHIVHTVILGSQEKLRHSHTAEDIVIKLQVILFIVFLCSQHSFPYKPLAIIICCLRIGAVLFCQHCVFHSDIRIVEVRLHDRDICFISCGSKHGQLIVSADNKGWVNKIVLIDLAGDICGQIGKGSSVLYRCKYGAVISKQPVQSQLCVHCIFPYHIICSQRINPVNILRIGSCGILAVVKPDQRSRTVGDHHVALFLFISSSEISQQLNSEQSAAAVFFDLRHRDGYIQPILIQTIFKRDLEGDRNDSLYAGSFHFDNILFLCKPCLLKILVQLSQLGSSLYRRGKQFHIVLRHIT